MKILAGILSGIIITLAAGCVLLAIGAGAHGITFGDAVVKALSWVGI